MFIFCDKGYIDTVRYSGRTPSGCTLVFLFWLNHLFGRPKYVYLCDKGYIDTLRCSGLTLSGCALVFLFWLKHLLCHLQQGLFV